MGKTNTIKVKWSWILTFWGYGPRYKRFFLLYSVMVKFKKFCRFIVNFSFENNCILGFPFKKLYWNCRESFLVSSDMALRAQLTEFVDHKMVRLRRSAEGTEFVVIPIANTLLKQFLNEQSKWFEMFCWCIYLFSLINDFIIKRLRVSFTSHSLLSVNFPVNEITAIADLSNFDRRELHITNFPLFESAYFWEHFKPSLIKIGSVMLKIFQFETFDTNQIGHN